MCLIIVTHRNIEFIELKKRFTSTNKHSYVSETSFFLM